MAAYAEGLSVLRNADIGKRTNVAADAETTPLRDPEHYRYDMNLRDIAEVWRRGSVIASWLLEHASPCGRTVRLLASSVRGKGRIRGRCGMPRRGQRIRMRLRVECYSGGKADERPIQLWIDGRHYRVDAV